MVHQRAQWRTEGFCTFGQNVINCTLVHKERRTTVIGAYIPPFNNTMTTMGQVDAAMRNENADKVILLGDLNMNMDHPKDTCSLEIVDSVS